MRPSTTALVGSLALSMLPPPGVLVQLDLVWREAA
jgi:hypothetical protein